MWPPEPRRGGKKIAQGKAAAAAALGKEAPQPTFLFSFFGLARCRRARPKKEKREEIILGSRPGAALVPRLPRADMRRPVGARSGARIIGE